MANSNQTSPNSSEFIVQSHIDISDSQLFIWPVGVVFSVGASASIFGNIMILKALASSHELRKNRCNILVANLAIADFVHAVYFLVFGISYIIANIFGLERISMSQETCFYAFIPEVIALDSASLTVLAIGVDRAMSLMKPIFYKNLSSKYIYCAIGASYLFGVVNALLGFKGKDPHETVAACAPPTALKGAAFAAWTVGNIIVDVLVIISYGVAYWKAKKLTKVRSVSNESILKNNRLLTSLVTFVCVYISSILVGNLIVGVSNQVVTSPVALFHIQLYAGIFIMLSTGCNFYIYYARSEEYRSVFRKVLGLKTQLKAKTITAQTSLSNNNSNRIVPVG